MISNTTRHQWRSQCGWSWPLETRVQPFSFQRTDKYRSTPWSSKSMKKRLRPPLPSTFKTVLSTCPRKGITQHPGISCPTFLKTDSWLVYIFSYGLFQFYRNTPLVEVRCRQQAPWVESRLNWNPCNQLKCGLNARLKDLMLFQSRDGLITQNPTVNYKSFYLFHVVQQGSIPNISLTNYIYL